MPGLAKDTLSLGAKTSLLEAPSMAPGKKGKEALKKEGKKAKKAPKADSEEPKPSTPVKDEGTKNGKRTRQETGGDPKAKKEGKSVKEVQGLPAENGAHPKAVGKQEKGPKDAKKKTKKKADSEKEPANKRAKKEVESGSEKTEESASASESGLGLGLGSSDIEEREDDPSALKNFPISGNIKVALEKKGIKALFPIQALTFNAVLGGQDLVARARTGQGKTLAFVLPILERLLKDKSWSEAPRRHGRLPRVIVLAPTRELAKQVAVDFEYLGEAVRLQTVSVYGGAPMGPQENALRRGVDVVVGTPGRVKDLLQRGTLSLRQLSFRVLDEADEMLNMGFVDDVEAILGAVDDASTVQTLLFSATIPAWVNKIAERFFKPNKKTVDLVGEEKLKASVSVRHLLLPCHWTQRNQVVTDLISCYSRGGRVIVFTETKNDASALAEGLAHLGARPLHGDIAQNHRESTLAGFRSGTFQVLVATDVAARGLDVSDVQLVVQCSPPQTEETYIHRSGRTGRAGATGVSVMLTGGKKDYMIAIIERKAGVKFERVSVPQPADIAKASATNAAATVQNVCNSVVPLFKAAAEHLVQESGLPPLELLAKALAKISGQTELKRRSLLTAHDDATTVHFKGTATIRTPTYVFATLRRLLPQESVDKVRRMTLTADGCGAVFDVPSELVDQFLEAFKSQDTSDSHPPVTLATPDTLPELQIRPDSNNKSPRSDGGFSRGRGGGDRSRRSGRGGGGGGRGRRGRSS